MQHIACTMPSQLSSTAQDLARGKRSEIDHLNGYVLRKGEALGIAMRHAGDGLRSRFKRSLPCTEIANVRNAENWTSGSNVRNWPYREVHEGELLDYDGQQRVVSARPPMDAWRLAPVIRRSGLFVPVREAVHRGLIVKRSNVTREVPRPPFQNVPNEFPVDIDSSGY